MNNTPDLGPTRRLVAAEADRLAAEAGISPAQATAFVALAALAALSAGAGVSFDVASPPGTAETPGRGADADRRPALTVLHGRGDNG